MALMQEAQQLVRGYIDGRVTRASVENWLARNAQAVADAHDGDMDRLFGRVSSLLAELGYGHRSEAEVRAELAAFLTAVQVNCTYWVTPPVTLTLAAAMPVDAQFHGSLSFLGLSLPVQRSPVIA